MAPGAQPALAEVASVSGLEDLLPNDEDLLYEEELLRNPFSLKMWWRYIEARKHVSSRKKYLLYERALKSLPGSYKVSSAPLGQKSLKIQLALQAYACVDSQCVGCWLQPYSKAPQGSQGLDLLTSCSHIRNITVSGEHGIRN